MLREGRSARKLSRRRFVTLQSNAASESCRTPRREAAGNSRNPAVSSRCLKLRAESRGARVAKTALGNAFPIGVRPRQGSARYLGHLRGAASVYLAFFFLAVAAAPHRHLNDFEDLSLDQRSDSGIILQGAGPASLAEEPAFRPIRQLHDVPCLACFTSDFLCAPTTLFSFFADLGVRPSFPCLRDAAMPAPMLVEATSRAPPRLV
jgi:hypothetical protein